MPQGIFWEKLIRLEAIKRIFIFRAKMDFFPRGKSMLFGQKWPNFQVGIFHLFISLGISGSRKTVYGIIFKCK